MTIVCGATTTDYVITLFDGEADYEEAVSMYARHLPGYRIGKIVTGETDASIDEFLAGMGGRVGRVDSVDLRN